MSKQWHKGPPPSVGWWPASTQRYEHDLRWWDGWRWSIPVFSELRPDAKYAARIARYLAPEGLSIEWTDRPKDWPARSHT